MIYGVGVYEKGKYAAKLGGKITREYSTWYNMLMRCYCGSWQATHPSYTGCEVDDRFHSFQQFMAWAENQVGCFSPGFQLEKDLLVKHNSIYSPETCVYVPREVNMFLVRREAHRGDLPIGVHLSSRNRFSAQISSKGKLRKVSGFDTPEAAFECYKEMKREEGKRLAEEFKEVIDPRAYKALLTYEVSITD